VGAVLDDDGDRDARDSLPGPRKKVRAPGGGPGKPSGSVFTGGGSPVCSGVASLPSASLAARIEAIAESHLWSVSPGLWAGSRLLRRDRHVLLVASFPSLDRPAVTPAAAGVRVGTLLGRQQVVHPPLARTRPSVQNSVKLNGTR
jgi:hypothetical protein